MIRKRPELDMENPPGQLVNRPTYVGTLQKEIAAFLDTEEAFQPQSAVACDTCGNKYWGGLPKDCEKCQGLCRSCETVDHCSKNGCIPVTPAIPLKDK